MILYWKREVSLTTLDFYAFKYIYAVIANESRYVATLDLTGFFLQTKIERDERILFRSNEAVALLLVEVNPVK